MIDLKNTTFMIPIRLESEDRIRNAFTTISYLINNFDTTVIVKEVDSESKFNSEVLPLISKVSDKKNLDKINYIFEKNDDVIFYRMQIMNEMLFVSNTDIVVNYDVDILLEKQTIIDAVKNISIGKADVVYPYGVPNYQKRVIFFDDMVANFFIKENYDFAVLHSLGMCVEHQSYAGHVQFFNRKVYIDGGMENENFKGYSPDDKERIHRFRKLGYNVLRFTDDYVYHLEHSRGINSSPNFMENNPYYNHNQDLWGKLKNMEYDELKKYYNDQIYLRKYVNV